jgi:hypothetical protein
MRVGSLLVALVAVVGLAACGSGTDTPPAPPGPGGGNVVTDGSDSLPDPCTLITNDEAAKAITVPVANGVHELVGDPSLGSGRECAFKAASGEGEARTGVYPNPGDLYDAFKLQEGQFGPVSDLAGVGDKAFTVGNGQCYVVKGTVLLEIVVFPGDKFKTDPEPRMIELCRSAAGRLTA